MMSDASYKEVAEYYEKNDFPKQFLEEHKDWIGDDFRYRLPKDTPLAISSCTPLVSTVNIVKLHYDLDYFVNFMRGVDLTKMRENVRPNSLLVCDPIVLLDVAKHGAPDGITSLTLLQCKFRWSNDPALERAMNHIVDSLNLTIHLQPFQAILLGSMAHFFYEFSLTYNNTWILGIPAQNHDLFHYEYVDNVPFFYIIEHEDFELERPVNRPYTDEVYRAVFVDARLHHKWVTEMKKLSHTFRTPSTPYMKPAPIEFIDAFQILRTVPKAIPCVDELVKP